MRSRHTSFTPHLCYNTPSSPFFVLSKTSSLHTHTLSRVPSLQCALAVWPWASRFSSAAYIPVYSALIQSPLKQDAFGTALRHPVGSVCSSYKLGEPEYWEVSGSTLESPSHCAQSGAASTGRVGTGESWMMALEQGNAWQSGSISCLLLALPCLSVPGLRPWLQLGHWVEAANRRGPHLSPGTMASPRPL